MSVCMQAVLPLEIFFAQLFLIMKRAAEPGADASLLPVRRGPCVGCVESCARGTLRRPVRPRTEIPSVLYRCEWVMQDGLLQWKTVFVNGKTKTTLAYIKMTHFASQPWLCINIVITNHVNNYAVCF